MNATLRPDFVRNPERGCAPGKANPDDFFTESADGQQTVVVAHCTTCPVMQACRDWAVTTRQEHGVWGGLTRQQLAAAIAEHRAQTPAPPKPAKPKPATGGRIKRWDPAVLDAEVAAKHAAGRSDHHIAISLGVHPRTVQTSRERQGLPVLYGPGGRRVRQAVSA